MELSLTVLCPRIAILVEFVGFVSLPCPRAMQSRLVRSSMVMNWMDELFVLTRRNQRALVEAEVALVVAVAAVVVAATEVATIRQEVVATEVAAVAMEEVAAVATEEVVAAATEVVVAVAMEEAVAVMIVAAAVVATIEVEVVVMEEETAEVAAVEVAMVIVLVALVAMVEVATVEVEVVMVEDPPPMGGGLMTDAQVAVEGMEEQVVVAAVVAVAVAVAMMIAVAATRLSNIGRRSILLHHLHFLCLLCDFFNSSTTMIKTGFAYFQFVAGFPEWH